MFGKLTQNYDKPEGIAIKRGSQVLKNKNYLKFWSKLTGKNEKSRGIAKNVPSCFLAKIFSRNMQLEAFSSQIFQFRPKILVKKE